MSNRVEAVVMFLACAREGLACNPSLHKTFTCAEIGELLTSLSARAFLTEAGWGADRNKSDLDAVLVRIPSLKVVYTPEAFPSPAANSTSPCTDPDKVAYLAFTSGTTGSPKCVMHSDNTLLANARDLVRDWKQGPDTVMLSLPPLSHHIAWVGIAQWLVSGGRFVTDDLPAGKSRQDWIVESGATYLLGVPTHAMDILAEQQKTGVDGPGECKVFYMAGAPIPSSVGKRFPRTRRETAKCLRHDGELVAPVHASGRPVETIVETCGRGAAPTKSGCSIQNDRDREVEPGR